MFDANKILGMLMESGMSRSGQSRAQRMAAGSGQSGRGGAEQTAGGGGSGGFADMARSMLGGDSDQGSGNRRGSGGGLADLAGSLFGGGGRTAGGVSGGAMGMLGTLASMAMQHFGQGAAQQGGQGAAQPAGQGASPGLAEAGAPYQGGAGADENGRATVMIRAMITAAKADGEIDPQERQQILGRLEQAGADPEEQAFVRDEMARPADMDAIVGAVDSPHTALEVYAASLFAIDVDTPAEKTYMRHLAQGLRLDPAMVRELHASLEAPQPT